MKKAYIITATALLGAPLILAAALKSVIPIIFWFLPVAAYLFLSHGKRTINDGKVEKNEDDGAKNASETILKNGGKARENGSTDNPKADYPPREDKKKIARVYPGQTLKIYN